MKNKIVDFYYDIYNIKKTGEYPIVLKIGTRHVGDNMATLDLRIGIDIYEIFYDFEDDEGYVKNQYESIISMGNKEELFIHLDRIFKYQYKRKLN